MHKWKACISKLLQYRPGCLFYCGQQWMQLFPFQVKLIRTHVVPPLNKQHKAVHQPEQLFKLNIITCFHVEYSIVVLSNGITGDENFRWHAAGHLGPQKEICLMWLQSFMKWVISQLVTYHPQQANGGRWVAISSHPPMLWLPRLSITACIAASPTLEIMWMMGRCGPVSGLRPVLAAETNAPSCVSVGEESVFRCRGLQQRAHGRPRAAPFAVLPPFMSAPTLREVAGGDRTDNVGEGLAALLNPRGWGLCAKRKGLKADSCILSWDCKVSH